MAKDEEIKEKESSLNFRTLFICENYVTTEILCSRNK
jgi:hypothetical protein